MAAGEEPQPPTEPFRQKVEPHMRHQYLTQLIRLESLLSRWYAQRSDTFCLVLPKLAQQINQQLAQSYSQLDDELRLSLKQLDQMHQNTQVITTIIKKLSLSQTEDNFDKFNAHFSVINVILLYNV